MIFLPLDTERIKKRRDFGINLLSARRTAGLQSIYEILWVRNT